MNRVSMALVLALAGIFVPFESRAAGKPVLIHMQAALDIDRDGRVAAVTYVDDEQVPDAIRQHGEQVAKGWTFVPPVKAGKSVAGRTYARMQVCLAPRDDSIDISIAYSGNGPATFFHARAPRNRLRTRGGMEPALPVRKLLAQGISSLQGKIIYVVSAEGKASLESATLDDPELQEQYGVHWLKEQRDSLKNFFRHRPELIDGVPTATRVESVVALEWSPGEDTNDLDARHQERDEQSDACKALRNDNGRQIASDSAFQRIQG